MSEARVNITGRTRVPGLDRSGVMFPYTGIHYMIFKHLDEPAFIMTSGNKPGMSMTITNKNAFRELKGIADFFLLHDRDIVKRTDESVLRIKVALNNIIKLAEIEASMREILDVMAAKRRQINRIQYKILPQLDATIRYIELILEETERQDALRVRVLQRKRKERALKST